MTLDIIAKLDQHTAKAFQYVASYVLIIPGQADLVISSIIAEDMIHIDHLLNNMAMRHLQGYGLFVASTGSSINPGYFQKLPSSTLGGEAVEFSATEVIKTGPLGLLPPMNGEAWPLSQSGMQLLPLLSKSLDRSYARRLRDGMCRLGVALTFPNIDINVDPSKPVPQSVSNTRTN
jgi:hypothetical protein